MDILNYIEKKAKEVNLNVHQKSGNSVSISTSAFLGITITFNLEDKEELSFYYFQRTTSWVYNGERTDLHDVIPIAFALFMKKINLCCLYFTDVFNPATVADNEIYAKYLTPSQISNKLLEKNSKEYLETIRSLIFSLILFEQKFWESFPGCPCQQCRNRLGYNFEFNFDIDIDKINHISTAIGSSEEAINYCERTLPTWFYYRDFKKGISIIQSDELSFFANDLLKAKPIETLDGLSGKLLLENDFSNYIGDSKNRDIHSIFNKLGDQRQNITLLENRIIAIGKKYIISFNYDCGVNKFQKEKNKLKLRHEKEFKLLFRPSEIEWSKQIEDSRFEDLIKDLLERESDVIRVRKTSHTRERDGGVDLIVDWKVPREFMNKEETNPYEILNVIVQCKAYKDGVSKSQVTDIRDTIELRNYNGYFLAVSSYLKKSLSDYLDKLRIDRKFWIDWWSRDEIEKKLKVNRDLIIKYNDIVQIKK